MEISQDEIWYVYELEFIQWWQQRWILHWLSPPIYIYIYRMGNPNITMDDITWTIYDTLISSLKECCRLQNWPLPLLWLFSTPLFLFVSMRVFNFLWKFVEDLYDVDVHWYMHIRILEEYCLLKGCSHRKYYCSILLLTVLVHSSS